MLERCIQLDRDCAIICWTASQFMSRDREYVKQICNTCTNICDAHAEECEKHSTVNYVHKHVGRRTCAEECRKMAR